ncbi:hypothetical protein BD779DRAFT_1600910 [Infundibulicybe gibba]|nr:hypothetical protein BD779DRAFT_1600910 [Infundibulicybe gibba]
MVRTSDVILILVAILFPPAAAGMITGCSCDLLINILLTILGYIPGHIHAFWLIYRKMQAEERYGNGGYQCAFLSPCLDLHALISNSPTSDMGNGQYEPVYNQGAYAPGQAPYYGATGR